MKKIIIRYHQRLGDIIQCLSMAKQLVAQGYELYIECNQEYHSIFKLCPYVMPIYPGQVAPRGFSVDCVIDPQIWPHRYSEYRKSKLKWWPFVTSQHPLLRGLEWCSPFEKALIPTSPIQNPENYLLIAATGFSQVPRLEPKKVIALATELYPHLLPITVGPQGKYMATSLCDLVSFVQKAGAVVTINTSIDYIADSVREDYNHIICEGFKTQDDFFSPKQTRHHIEFIPIL